MKGYNYNLNCVLTQAALCHRQNFSALESTTTYRENNTVKRCFPINLPLQVLFNTPGSTGNTKGCNNNSSAGINFFFIGIIPYLRAPFHFLNSANRR